MHTLDLSYQFMSADEVMNKIEALAQNIDALNLRQNIIDKRVIFFINKYCKGVKRLYLGHSSFNCKFLEFLKNLNKLEYLDISQSEIGENDLRFLKNFPQLRRIDIFANKLVRKNWEDICNCQNVDEILGFDTNIQGKDLENFNKLKELKKLVMYNTEIDNLFYLSECKKMEYLDVSYSLIQSNTIKDIPKSIISLRLLGTNVDDNGVNELTKLKKLEKLYIGPNITEKSFLCLKEMNKLNYLYIMTPYITERSIPYITNLKHIKKICFATKVNNKHIIMEMMGKLPSSEIGFEVLH